MEDPVGRGLVDRRVPEPADHQDARPGEDAHLRGSVAERNLRPPRVSGSWYLPDRLPGTVPCRGPWHRVSGETGWRERQRHATDGAEAATTPRTPTSIQRRRRRPLDPSPSESPGEPGFTAVAVGEIQITGGPLTLRFRGRWTSIGSTRRCPPCIPIAAARRASRVGAGSGLGRWRAT